MINITCSDRDSLTDIKKIISEKNKGVVKDALNKILHRINVRYSEFSKVELGNRIKADLFTEEEKNSLLSLYKSKTATAKEITEPLIRNQMLAFEGRCLSCGIGDIDEIDHFLPKEYFPEFSILHKNLVPICGRCNELKGSNIPGEKKDYIHPMFDLIPSEPFIYCQIEYIDGLPSANFDIIDKFKNTRVDAHFKNLKLDHRLTQKSTQYFLQIKAYQDDLGDEFAKEEIDRDVLKIGAIFGTRYWKYILCQEMVKTNYIDKLKSR